MTTASVDPREAGASAKAIQYHYDVSNDFYRLWLDSSLTYSCALWEEGDTLEAAQQRKIDFHARNCQAGPGKVFLDIGCGWGSTLEWLVTRYDVARAVGLTLSDAQAQWVKALRLPRTQVLVQGWQDYAPAELFDGVISIGAFEHFAKPDLTDEEMIGAYRQFFEKCHAWLKPTCSLSLQTIAYGQAKRAHINPFILKEIFPESDLPNLSQIVRAAEGLFEVVSLRNDRQHYATTFRHWSDRLKARLPDAVRLVGSDKLEKYKKYQGLFIIGFHTGAMDLYRLHLRRVGK